MKNRFKIAIHGKSNIHQFVKPKTNCWWTKQEFSCVHSNMLDYRQERLLLKQNAKIKRPNTQQSSNPIDFAFKNSKFTPITSKERLAGNTNRIQFENRPESRLSNVSRSIFMSEMEFEIPLSGTSRGTDRFMNREWKSHNPNNLKTRFSSSAKLVIEEVDYSRGYIPAIVVDFTKDERII